MLRYAIATGRAEHDFTADLRGALARVKTEHFAALTEQTADQALPRPAQFFPGELGRRISRSELREALTQGTLTPDEWLLAKRLARLPLLFKRFELRPE